MNGCSHISWMTGRSSAFLFRHLKEIKLKRVYSVGFHHDHATYSFKKSRKLADQSSGLFKFGGGLWTIWNRARIGCKFHSGGSPSAISMAVIAKLEKLTSWNFFNPFPGVERFLSNPMALLNRRINFWKPLWNLHFYTWTQNGLKF